MKKCALGRTHSAAFLTTLLGVGIAAGIAWATPEEASSPGFAWKDGAEVYAKVCAYCHETGVGPVLRGRGLPPAVVNVFVRNGSRAMPPFRAAEIDDAALAKLGEYISKH